MTRLWSILRAAPRLVWAILAGLGALLMLLGNARRKGEKVGAAKATAAVETANVKEMVHEAEKTAQVAQEARGRVEAAGGNESADPGARDAAVAAEAQARAATERLRNDLLTRARR
jgi:hypothetical protein